MKKYLLVVPAEYMRFLKIEAAKAEVTVKEYIMISTKEKAERDNLKNIETKLEIQ